jgi:hypothetical protein
MAFWRRAIGLGFVVWLGPFLVAFLAFPLKQSWRSLFESIMPVTLSVVVIVCTLWSMRRTSRFSFRESAALGLLWWAMCVAIDLPLMLNPPINYTLVEYAADIGLTYAMIPAMTMGMAQARASTVPTTA